MPRADSLGLVVLSFCLINFSCAHSQPSQAKSGAQAKPVEAPAVVAPRYAPASVAQVSELLVGMADQLKPLKAIGKNCKAWGHKAAMLSQSLHAIWDETVQALKPRAHAEALAWSKSCEKECACDLYAEAAADEETSVPGVAALRSLAEKNVSPSRRVECARQISEPCKTALWREISSAND